MVGQLKHFVDNVIHDVAVRRRTLLIFFFCLALLAEIWLLEIDLPQHKDLVLHVAVSVSVILLPLTMSALAARLPLGRRLVRRRFIIRPFGRLSTNSPCDGKAIAALVYRAIVSFGSSSKGGIEGQGSAQSLPTTNVVLGGATLPLDWLWAQLRFMLTGKKDVIIDGLLIDSEPISVLEIWTTDNGETWSESFTNESVPQSLHEAIRKLAPLIIESLDPVQLARINYDRWNFDEAISLMQLESKWQDLQLEIADMSL